MSDLNTLGTFISTYPWPSKYEDQPTPNKDANDAHYNSIIQPGNTGKISFRFKSEMCGGQNSAWEAHLYMTGKIEVQFISLPSCTDAFGTASPHMVGVRGFADGANVNAEEASGDIQDIITATQSSLVFCRFPSASCVFPTYVSNGGDTVYLALDPDAALAPDMQCLVDWQTNMKCKFTRTNNAGEFFEATATADLADRVLECAFPAGKTAGAQYTVSVVADNGAVVPLTDASQGSVGLQVEVVGSANALLGSSGERGAGAAGFLLGKCNKCGAVLQEACPLDCNGEYLGAAVDQCGVVRTSLLLIHSPVGSLFLLLA